jgi:hypothetical protein
VAAPEDASLEVSLKQQKVKGRVATTGDYGKFQWTKLGQLEIEAKGKSTLALHGVREGWHPVNVKAIRLTPLGR